MPRHTSIGWGTLPFARASLLLLHLGGWGRRQMRRERPSSHVVALFAVWTLQVGSGGAAARRYARQEMLICWRASDATFGIVLMCNAAAGAVWVGWNRVCFVYQSAGRSWDWETMRERRSASGYASCEIGYAPRSVHGGLLASRGTWTMQRGKAQAERARRYVLASQLRLMERDTRSKAVTCVGNGKTR